jgi:hypothetical protein
LIWKYFDSINLDQLIEHGSYGDAAAVSGYQAFKASPRAKDGQD